MPACCIKGCHNRSDNVWAKNIKLFCFPKEEVIRQQWLKACGRNEADIKVNSARICNLHFEEDCFEMRWTKPRLKNISARKICRLKRNAVPTKSLNIKTKKTKAKKMKTIVRTGIPTYIELLKYAREQQQIHENANLTDKATIEEQNIQQRSSNKNIFESDMITEEETDTMNEIPLTEQDVSTKILMNLLEKERKEKEILIKEKNQLLVEKHHLVENNIRLSQQVENLQKDVEEKSEFIIQMVKNKDIVPLHAKVLLLVK